MTSEVEERPRLITAGYGGHRSQWVNFIESYGLINSTDLFKLLLEKIILT